MASSNDDSTEKYQNAPTCASGSAIVYAWALDADKTELPKGWIIVRKKFVFPMNDFRRCGFQNRWFDINQISRFTSPLFEY